MKPSRVIDYGEEFLSIQRVKENNISLLKMMMECITTFSGNITQFIQNLLKIPHDLQIQKPKKFFSFRKNDNTISVTDTEFNNIWTIISNEYIKLHPGITEMNELLSNSFMNDLKQVLSKYTTSMNQLETDFNTLQSQFHKELEVYNNFKNSYHILCSQIDYYHNKAFPENTQGKNIELLNELKSQFQDCMARYSGVCEEFKEATDNFNKFYLKYSTESQHLLSNFEKIDHDHEENVKEILLSLINKIKEISEIKKKAEMNIKELINPDDVSKAPKIEQMSIDSKDIIQIIPVSADLNLCFSDYINIALLFSDGILQKMAVIVSDAVQGLPKGTIVIVIEELGSNEAAVLDIKQKIAMVVSQENDIEIRPELKRRIAEFRKDQQNNDDFTWKEGEYVLTTPLSLVNINDEYNQEFHCIDVLGRSGIVSVENLNFQIEL